MRKANSKFFIKIIMTLVCAMTLLCGAAAVHAEGSRDIVRTTIENANALGVSNSEESENVSRWSFRATNNDTSFMGVKDQQRIKFYAFQGEYFYLAQNSVSGSVDAVLTYPDGSTENIDLTEEKGLIKNRAQEDGGPIGVKLPDKSNAEGTGFTAWSKEATQSGVYIVDFKSKTMTDGKGSYNMNHTGDFNSDSTHFHSFDVTVAKKEGDSYNGLSGRVWMDALSLQETGKGIYGDLYCVTRDGYIWRFSLNGMAPNTFAMYANSRGGIGSGTNASAYHSVHAPLTNYTKFDFYKNSVDKNGNPDGILILGPDNAVTDIDSPYHMFFNYPDVTMSDSIVQAVPQKIGEIESIRFDGKTGNDDTVGQTVNESGYAGVGGYFEVRTKGVTSYRIIIDMSNMYAIHYHGEMDGGAKFDENSEYGNEHNEEICLSTDNDYNFIFYDKNQSKWKVIKTNAKLKDNSNPNRHPTNQGDISEPEARQNYIKIEDLPADAGITGDPATPETKQMLEGKKYKSLGKIMLGNAAVDGVNRIKWDGRDQYGRILPIGTYFGDTGMGEVYAEPKAGEIHFPLGDVESMKNGLGIWLENAPEWMETGSNLTSKIAARSKLYYNNLDLSLLRDFTYQDKEASSNKEINNTWMWNLPNNINNFASGQRSDNADKLGRAWVSGNAVFEDFSIDGINSYEYDSSHGLGDESDRKSTKKAAQFIVAGDSTIPSGVTSTHDAGCDHGIVDVWTYIPAPTEYKKTMDQLIAMNSLDTQKIITGFVFLDDPTQSVKGTYDKLTNDRELPDANVKAEYGTYSNLQKLHPGQYSDKSPEEKIVYETKTNSNGYYSIPIDMEAFDPADTKYNVTITITYSDPMSGEAVVTHGVTTAGKHDRKFNESQIIDKNSANTSILTLSLYEQANSGSTYMKEIYANDVGYVINPSTSLRIHADWTPDVLKDMSMAANFTVYGVYKTDIDGDATIKNLLDKELNSNGKDNYICENQDDYKPLTAEERQKVKEFFENHKVYEKDDIILDFKLSAITTVEDLPGYTLKTETQNTNTSVVKDKDIVYRAFYNGDAPLDSVSLERSPYKSTGTGAKNYDDWFFKINTQPSSINLTVWYDANHNEIKDEGEQGIEGARIKLAKRKAEISGDLNNEEYYMDSFERIKRNNDQPDEKEDDAWLQDIFAITDKTVFITDKDGVAHNVAYGDYDEENNSYSETNKSDTTDETGIQGLIAGRYKVTIILPPGSTYNTAAFTGAGLPDGVAGTNDTITASFDPEHYQITQYIDVPANGNVDSRAAYAYMAGLSIFKNVEPYNTTKQAITNYVSPMLFAYKLSLSNISIAEGTEETVIPVEDAETGLNGVENAGNNNKKLHFKKRDGETDPSAIFTLKAGERITINNLPNGTKYTIKELDNNNELLLGMTKGEIDEIPLDEFKETDSGVERNEFLRVFNRNKNMPTGFELSNALYNEPIRRGSISETARTSFVNYTNKYQPIQVTAYGGTEPVDKKDGEIKDGSNHNSIKISARVLLDGRKFKESDNFSLALEPSTWFLRDEEHPEIHTPMEGLSPDVLESPNTKNIKNTIDLPGANDVDELTADFDKSYTMTFTQPGVYSYVLRERRPFTSDNIQPIPGVKYSDMTYKLYIDVTDDASTGHLIVSNYFWRAKKTADYPGPDAAGVDDWDMEWATVPMGANPARPDDNFNKPPVYGDSAGDKIGKSMLEFNNTYDLTPPEVAFEGTKILNGRALDEGEFEFKIEPVGMRKNNDRNETTTDEVKNKMPKPASDTTLNTGATETNNIKFAPITFTEDNAGEDEASAMIYHYRISEIKPEDGSAKPSVEYDTKNQDVYVRVYKEVVADPDNEGQFYQIVHALQCDSEGNSTSGFAFTNSYTAEHLELSLSGDTENSLGLKLKKTLTSEAGSSRAFKEGDEFRFAIEPENGAPAISGSADGRTPGVLIFNPEGEDIGKTEKTDIQFVSEDKIEFTEANTEDKPYYEYTIRELNPYGDASVTALPGISYDSTRYRLRVYVKDDTAQGKLVLDKDSSSSKTGIDLYKITDEHPEGELQNGSPAEMPDLEFTNHYDPNRIDVPLSANKTFNRDFTTFFGKVDGTETMNQGFGFTLTPIGFVDDISSVGELTPFNAGVLKTDGDGEYESEANMPMPEVGKQYTESSKDFYIDSTGLIDLKKMTFESKDAGSAKTSAKVYIYKLTEKNEGRGGVTYDSDDRYIFLSVYMLSDDVGDTQYVTVALNDADDIAKIAEIHNEYNEANIDYTFANTYNAAGSEFDLNDSNSLKIIKKVTTQNVDAPDFTEGLFKVKLEPFNSSNSQLPPGFTNEDGYVTFNIDTSGNFVFDNSGLSSEYVDTEKLNGTKLKFDTEGTYEYLIREVTPAEDGIDGEDGYTYDTYQYKLTLDVKDDLKGKMEITPSVQWRSSLGASWSSEFNTDSDESDPHMPEDYKGREDKNISATDIVFVNSYTQQHTLNYNSNAALSGSENLPPQAEYEKDTPIEVYKTEGALTRNPGEMFVGWSTYKKDGDPYTDEERTAALTAEDAAKAKDLNILSTDDDGTDEDPGNTDNNIFTMPDADAILYAVWAIDANTNNIPDYAEDGYSVEYYIGNAVVDPDDEYADKEHNILYTCAHHHVAGTEADFLSHNGNIVTVNGTDVKLTLPDSGNPAFIGWGLTSSYKDDPVVDEYPGVFSIENLSGLISSINLTDELMKNPNLIKTRDDGRKVLTVYAVWAGDSHGAHATPEPESSADPSASHDPNASSDPNASADPSASPKPTPTPGPEVGDGIPDYKQVAYRGNKPADADHDVVGVPVDGNEYIPGESYVSLLTAPSLDGYRFLGWTDVETPIEDTIYYQPGMHWGPKTTKLDLFYAQWAKNEQSLIVQVFDDLNNDGVYEGDGALLNIAADKVVMTPKNGGEPVNSEIRIEGGGVQFTKDNLKPGEYTLTVTIDEPQFDAYDRYTGVNYVLGDEQGTITTNLDGTKLTINQDITIPYEDYSGAIRYGVTRPYDVIYNMNGAPVEVRLKDEAVRDKDYAYHEGDGVYYTDTTVDPNRVYDGKVEILGPDDLNATIVPDGNGGYVFTDSAGVPHRFLGWSVDPTKSEPDDGMTVDDLAEGGPNRGESFYNMTAGDLTLYAVWNRGFSQYPLTLDSNGGTFKSGTDNVGTLIGDSHYVLVADKDTFVPLDETTNWPGVQDQDNKYNVPNISRENAVFIGWSLTPVGAPVNDYNLVKDSLLSSIQMLTANTVYAVWAEDTRGRLVDSEGRGCDTPNAYYGDGHSGCVDAEGNPKHGELRTHASDGIADYLQVFYEFNPPEDAEISGSLDADPTTYGTDGKYTLDSDALGTFSDTDAAAIVERDYTSKGLQSPAESPDPDAKAYIRSSSLAVKGYAFDGWSLNDPSASTGKASNGMCYAGPTNGLGREYSFEKSAGKPDVLYAVWRKIVPAVVNIRVYNDANRNGVYDLDEPLVSGFSLSDVKEVIKQPNGSELTDPNVPTHDNKDNDTGNIVISNFEESVYEMTLTLDNSEANSKLVTRTNGVGTYFAHVAGPSVDELELKADKSGAQSVKFRYRAKEEFVGGLYVAVTEGHAITYDINGADSDKVIAPDMQDKLYYDMEYDIAKCPLGPDGTQLSEDEQGLYYTDDNGVKRYFLGWSSNKYVPEPEYPVGSDHKVNSKIKITGDMTLYAIWSADTYRVVYDLNGANEGQEPNADFANRRYEYGDTAALWMPVGIERPQKEGAIFIGWSEEKIDENLTSIPPVGTIVTAVTMPNQNKYVYAVWADNSNGDDVPDIYEGRYFVKYHSNGGFPDPDPNPEVEEPDDHIFFVDYSKTYLKGDTAQLITAEEGKQRISKDGAVLIGWSETPYSENVKSVEERDELMISGGTIGINDAADKTVYALWAEDVNNNGTPDYEERQFRVVYDGNGADEGSSVPADEKIYYTMDYAQLAAVPYEGLAKAGAALIGWTDNLDNAKDVLTEAPADGVLLTKVTMTKEEVDAQVPDGSAPGTKTVYAVWAVDTNGGTEPGKGDGVADVYQIRYEPGTEEEVKDLPVDNNKYEPGTEITLEPSKFGSASPSWEGHTFEGWRINGGETVYRPGETFVKSGKLDTITAVWSVTPPDRFGVVYMSNGGNDSVPIDDNTYPIGSDVTVADKGELARDGAVFVGWTKNNYQQIIISQDEIPEKILNGGDITQLDLGDNSSVMTLYAVWGVDITDGTNTVIEDGIADYYQVFYNANAGRETVLGMPEPDIGLYFAGTDVDVNTSSTPQREGYSFLGWSLNDPDGDPMTDSSFRKSPTVDVLYAVWEPLVEPSEYGVIYHENHATYGVVPVDDNMYVIDGTDNIPVLGNDGSPKLVKEGAAFIGWSKTRNDVIATRYDAANAGILGEFTRIEQPPGSGYMNLYAVWAKDENGDDIADYTQAIFDDGVDDGAADTVRNMPAAIEGMSGETYDIPEQEPERDGYKFKGWVERGTEGPVYKRGTAESSFIMPEDGIVFVAVWEKSDTPEIQPSEVPGEVPTETPGSFVPPTGEPSQPTDEPPGAETPTPIPTKAPTPAPPTVTPTNVPTTAPTTAAPTNAPTTAPPAITPTPIPTATNTPQSTVTPTPTPTATNTPQSTVTPTPTKKPSGGGGGGGGGGTFGTGENTSLRVQKEWEDDNNSHGERPSSVTVRLKQGVTLIDECTLSASNNWQYTFTSLRTGTTYTVEEVGVNHYVPRYVQSFNGYKIINQYDATYDPNADTSNTPSPTSVPTPTRDPNSIPSLNYDDHYAYIVGYEDGTVQPDNTITRAEVATIFFRMLSDESRDNFRTTENPFSDMTADDWFNTAVSTMTNADVIHGYEDGTFRGDNAITRAEFATIAAYFDPITFSGEDKFSDTSGHWASGFINRAAERGWINGYEDGSFRPDRNITRAEAMTLVNRVLGRKPDSAHLLADMITWPDNSDTTVWYYADVQEATNSHYSEDAGTYEIWTSLREVRDWTALEN